MIRAKSGLCALAVVAGSLFASAATADDYAIDPAHSFIEFRIKHLGYSWLVGRFDTLSGTFSHDGNNPADNAVAVEVDTNSINTNHVKRDTHLRSEDFLNVANFPTATFKSTGYSGDTDGGTLNGDLTLMGTTKPVAIEVTRIGEGEDPWGGYRAGFEGTVTIARADFGDTYNLGPASEQMQLNLFVEGIRQ